MVAPAISNVTSAHANGTVKAGGVIDITVEFDQEVTVTGTPRILMDVGQATYATYLSGSTGLVLTFRYTVAAADVSADLDYDGTDALGLNSGTIKDTLTGLVDATLTLAAPGDPTSLSANKALVVDAAHPTVVGVTSAHADGAFGIGEVIDIDVEFSEAVTVTGAPRIAMDVDNGARYATYLSGSTTDTLTFRFTVAADDTSAALDYVTTTSLGLNSGTINATDDSVSATLTLAAPGDPGSISDGSAIEVDTTRCTVDNVTSTHANGTLGAGVSVVCTVHFTETVYVTGVPRLTLQLNPARRATYTSGSGSATLSFTFVTQSPDQTADLDYRSINSLALYGGTIKDAAGNDAILTLPTPGAAGSIGANKAIVIATPGVTGGAGVGHGFGGAWGYGL